MELLDRYLQAVRRHLPWERQDDIIAELKANLESQLEDKEAELGRKLTDAEMEAWLKQLGSPLLVAARYRPQRYLIGPALFPIYWFVLRLVMTWYVIVYAIAKTVDIVARGLTAGGVIGAIASLPWSLLVSAAIVTLVFAGIEAVGARHPEKHIPLESMAAAWSPAELPPLTKDTRTKPGSSAKALVEVIFGFLLFWWLLLVPHYPYLMFGPGGWYLSSLPFKLAPVWWTFYWCIVALNAFELTWKTVHLARGEWQKREPLRHTIMRVISLVPLGTLLIAPDHVLFQLKNPATEAARYGAQLTSANKGLTGAIALASAIVVLQLLWGAGKMGVDAYRRRLAAR